jgi:hypothetical protein
MAAPHCSRAEAPGGQPCQRGLDLGQRELLGDSTARGLAGPPPRRPAASAPGGHRPRPVSAAAWLASWLAGDNSVTRHISCRRLA